MSLSPSNATLLLVLDLLADSCDLGSTDANADLRIYSGTPPINCDTALSGNTVLAQLEMSNPAFGAATDANPGATVSANALTADVAADATGTATFFRIFDRNNVARVQGNVTATGGGGELELNSVSIVAATTVTITSLVMTHPE